MLLLQVALGAQYHVDHKIPIANGGAHELANFALACSQCNQEKYTKTLEEYRVWRRKNRLPVLF
ncbi:MAG: HNH endonuclease [Methyloceanibacter sp.]